jgi:hypothetical protein
MALCCVRSIILGHFRSLPSISLINLLIVIGVSHIHDIYLSLLINIPCAVVLNVNDVQFEWRHLRSPYEATWMASPST